MATPPPTPVPRPSPLLLVSPSPSQTPAPPAPVPPSPCSGLVDPACVHNAGSGDKGSAFGPPPLPDIVGHFSSTALDSVAKAFQTAVSWVVSNSASWWVKGPSPNLEAEPVVAFMQAVLQPVTIAVAVTALLIAAGKLALTRKASPLIDVGSGLVILAVTTVLSVALPDRLLQWGDDWADWVLTITAGGDFASRVSKVFTLPSGVPAGVVLILCLIALFVGIIQAVLLLFRQAALLVLAGMLPLAAAGTLTQATKPWFKKVTAWMLALIFYKPCAALVYAVAFALIGEGHDFRAILLGLAMMVISLIAFPVLLKFFSWTTGGTEAAGGGGQFLGAIIGGATAVGALRSYGGSGSGGSGASSASEHAAFLHQQLGDQGSAGQDHGERQPAGQPPVHLPGPGQSDSPHIGQGQMTDPGAPTGGGPPGGEVAPHDGGSGDEPVGPVAFQTFEGFANYTPNIARWLNNPSGSQTAGGSGDVGGEGGPSGAAAGGGAGGA